MVDDDLLSLESLSSFLSSEGYSIEAYSEVDSALLSIAEKEYDIVASDYMLKDENGIDLLNHVKLMKPGTFTILFTGFGSSDLNKKLEKYDIDLFLTKPLILKDLLSLFERIKKEKSNES